MENKKYRTFEIVDGKIKITNAISKFMRFVSSTCYFADKEKEEREFIKRCEVIGYLFSGNYSSRMNVLIFNGNSSAGNGKSLFVKGIGKLLDLYKGFNNYNGYMNVAGRDNSINKRIDMFKKTIEKLKPSFIHIDDMFKFFDFVNLIAEVNNYSVSIRHKNEADNYPVVNFIPLIITTNIYIIDIPEFGQESTHRRFYTLHFGSYYVYNCVTGEFGKELFENDYSTEEYIQDLIFCMDCLDFYNDLNADNVTI